MAGKIQHHKAIGGLDGALLRRLESGSMDGGSFGDIVHMPLMISLLVLGLMVAMVGFWRVGASYSAQRSAQTEAVTPSAGDGVMTQLLRNWIGGDPGQGDVNVDAANRTVWATVDDARTVDAKLLGAWQAEIPANTRIRSERFYPGQPVCDADGCYE
jgi:hypothetical protein